MSQHPSPFGRFSVRIDGSGLHLPSTFAMNPLPRLTLALILLLSACGGGDESDPPPPPLHAVQPALDTNETVLFFGDSITQLWSTQEYVPGAMNAGISGNETSQMLARFDADVLAKNPSVVVILGGTNDIRNRQTADPVSLYAMVEKAMAAHARVIVGTLPPIDPGLSHDPQLQRRLVAAYNKAIADGAMAYGYETANFHDALILSNGNINRTLFADGLHPNHDGFNEMWYVLRPVLTRAVSAANSSSSNASRVAQSAGCRRNGAGTEDAPATAISHLRAGRSYTRRMTHAITVAPPMASTIRNEGPTWSLPAAAQTSG